MQNPEGFEVKASRMKSSGFPDLLGRLVLSSCGVVARRAKPQARRAKSEVPFVWDDDKSHFKKYLTAETAENAEISLIFLSQRSPTGA